MKQFDPYGYIRSLFFLMALITACGAQEKLPTSQQAGKIIIGDSTTFDPAELPSELPKEQIAEYIRNIQEDKNGGLWFGTNGYGVAHYDGDSVSYFSNDQGFHGQQITGMTEDLDNNLWFATDQGIVKYDWSSNDKRGKRFTNYSDHKYLVGHRFWSVFADNKGNIWAGSARGIFKFNGTDWAPFDLPYPEKAEKDNFITKRTTWGITEDGDGNIWFSTNGYGAFKYMPGQSASDGNQFTRYSEADGLTDNSVDQILADSKGNIWFGTRHGGLSRLDGDTYTNYTQANSIDNNEVCIVYEDKMGNIWFSAEGYGVYRYDPLMAYLPPSRKTFINYAQEEGLGVRAVQTIYEDGKGRLWAGGGGGLYRLDKSSNRFINVGRNGPWE